MFLHSTGSLAHLLVNMLVLYMVGGDLERHWGPVRFLRYYLVCGVGAGVFVTWGGLLTNPRFGSRVTRLFVSRPLRGRLLGYAATTEEDINIIRYARRVLQQPQAPAGPHDDHFHLRIGCSQRDAASGCRD